MTIAAAPRTTLAEQVPELLGLLGVTAGFGIPGGTVAPTWDAIARSPLELLHFRHECGAVFAAVEAYFATGAPVAVCVTGGPGITNAITGLHAARSDGAKVLLVSGATPKWSWGRHPFQETSPAALGADMFTEGPLFHYAALVDNELTDVVAPLAAGMRGPGGFVAHLSLTRDGQLSGATRPLRLPPDSPQAPPDPAMVALVADFLRAEHMTLWLGFGARHAASEIRELVERTGTRVLCSPRAKGIFPERHPAFVGVTGLAGGAFTDHPHRMLVLGSGLGEMTSFWSPDLVPPRGFVHVDLDEDVPGSAYPGVPLIPVHCEIRAFLREVLDALPARTAEPPPGRRARPVEAPRSGPVRPQVLMAAVQRVIVDGSDATVLAEAGNSFLWAGRHLEFDTARYRVSTGFGAMGHAATGVLGAAHAVDGKAVAIVGDGALLMNNEISTAVQYQIPAVWVVLNDSAYGMVRQGMTAEGLRPEGVRMPRTDFVGLARAMGADGITVTDETELDQALAVALAAPGPFVLDVLVDDTCSAPMGERVASLTSQRMEL
ncbi:acetolactate synthase-1/2/3 large subunit [Lentzea waywayandensis]|uniref:Acetolactate synthase-1/2/3 large subunit n=1 Tax=Lentzea waywayandensis TaxID=84724 RepID=A0A1I6FJU4_9PSEU|nr:thiamine pyrophosphate-binding protein [Lentzea waywayandensis]SFR30158.1 acetolactate synthase-1/2/3 large subunit [Lentzea waywayandensis]